MFMSKLSTQNTIRVPSIFCEHLFIDIQNIMLKYLKNSFKIVVKMSAIYGFE